MSEAKPDVKCLQCGWEGEIREQHYATVCNGETGCCVEPECPECGSAWPVYYDDKIPEAKP